MIAAKASNQAAVLKYFAKYRSRVAPEVASAMRESADKILDSRTVLRLDLARQVFGQSAWAWKVEVPQSIGANCLALFLKTLALMGE